MKKPDTAGMDGCARSSYAVFTEHHGQLAAQAGYTRKKPQTSFRKGVHTATPEQSSGYIRKPAARYIRQPAGDSPEMREPPAQTP